MTRGTDVPTHPTAETIEGSEDSEGSDDSESSQRSSSQGSGSSAGPPAAGRGPMRALRTAGFHLVALAGLTVPAVVLWGDVWSGHPTAVLTCGCGDPAQQVWFTAWPAWAVAHLHNPLFSGAVNVPDGANLLSNTSGTLIGVALAPVTWAFGPVAATNVALTLAPGLSAWGCFAAVRPLVTWKAAAVPAALVYGYSAAVVSSLAFGHVSLTVLVVPPLLFTTLHEIVVRQEHSVRRDALVLGALLVVQFFISPEVLVMCLIFSVIGILAVAAVGWRQVRPRAAHALPALTLGGAGAGVVLAYPIWFGLAGPQAVTGVLFALAPLAGVSFSGVLAPGDFGAPAGTYVRFGGYLGHSGPPHDYLGGGVVLAAVASVVAARRRALTWLLVLLALLSFWFALGAYLHSAPSWLSQHLWMPWRDLSKLPLFEEILADQFAPLIPLFAAFLLAVGLDSFAVARRRPGSWAARHRVALAATATAVVTLVAVVPVFATFDVPLRVVRVAPPPWMRLDAPKLPSGTVVLTVPFAVSGSAEPMLWQAVEELHFRLAGAALKTPDASGGPVGQGKPGSARRILTDLTIAGDPRPPGTREQLAAVRRAVAAWQVERVVVPAGTGRDPRYASGFMTKALGVGPSFVHGAWVWTLRPGTPLAPPAAGVSLSACRDAASSAAARTRPLFMARCVLLGAGRPWVQA